MLSNNLLSIAQIKQLVGDFLREEDGQGINEYAACMAFVSLLAILAFGLTQGSYAQALLGSYDSITFQFDRLNSARP